MREVVNQRVSDSASSNTECRPLEASAQDVALTVTVITSFHDTVAFPSDSDSQNLTNELWRRTCGCRDNTETCVGLNPALLLIRTFLCWAVLEAQLHCFFNCFINVEAL